MAGRILVVGAGVIGTVLAVRLARAGFEVTLFARGERLREVREKGLRIRHAALGLEESADVRVVEALPAAETFDQVLVTVRADAIGSLLQDVGRVQAGAVAVLGNNAEGHAEQAQAAGPQRFVLGFGGFGGVREAGGITWIDGRTREKPGPGGSAKVMLGVLSPAAAPAMERVACVLTKAGFATEVSPDPVAWLQCHLALVLPLAGAIYAAGGEAARVCRTRDALVLGLRACRQTLRALGAQGVRIEPARLRTLLWLPEWLFVPRLGKGLRSEAARVAVFGHANSPGGRDELAKAARALDRLVRTAATATPSWDRLLPYLEGSAGAPLLEDGSRSIPLRPW